MRNASAGVRDTVRRRYYEPYRRDVRRADVGLLYDPTCARERDLCIRWRRALQARAADWNVRRNYPYLGRSDGLTSYLRKHYGDDMYAGVELEVNQKRVRNGAFPARDRRVITAALLDALASQRAIGPSDAR